MQRCWIIRGFVLEESNMYEHLKKYWNPFIEDNRKQVIVFGLLAPLLVAVPSLLAVIMVHGSFVAGITNFLLLFLFFILFAVMPVMFLFLSVYRSHKFRISWAMISGIFFILWCVIFQIAKFYF